MRGPGDGTLQADARVAVLRSRMDGFVSGGCTVQAEMLGTFLDLARDGSLLIWLGVHSLDHRQDLLCFHMPRSPLGPDHWLRLHELHSSRTLASCGPLALLTSQLPEAQASESELLFAVARGAQSPHATWSP